VDQPPERDHRIRELEGRFRSAGLPLLAEDYSATEDVFNRAIPLLAVVFVLEILGAINLDWPPALNVLALFGGVALVLVAFGLLNASRGRRLFSVPQKLDAGDPRELDRCRGPRAVHAAVLRRAVPDHQAAGPNGRRPRIVLRALLRGGVRCGLD